MKMNVLLKVKLVTDIYSYYKSINYNLRFPDCKLSVTSGGIL